MNDLSQAAIALEEALKALLGIFGQESTTPEAIDRLHERCCDLTTGLVTATTASSSAELQEAAPALRRAQRLNAIARALVELASHERLRLTMGRAARARVRERYSAEELADRLERVYGAVVEEVACAS